MPIDSESRRRSAAHPLVPILPVPDGTIDEEDRRTVAGIYAGLGSEGVAGITRQLVFGIDPDKGLVGTYSWAGVPDKNSDQYGITCAYVPDTKGNIINIFQETLFFGTINAGLTYQTFRDDLGMDGAADNIGGEIITGRVDPTHASSSGPLGGGAETDNKRFLGLLFLEVNPLSGGASVQVARNAVDPHLQSPVWENLAWSSPKSKATIDKGVAGWIHIRLVDNTTTVMAPVFGSFQVNYYNLGPQDAEQVGV